MANPDISLLGATYPGVTGVTLPKSGGGTATFPWVEGSETKTANGTYDVTNLAELVVNVSGGGGASNVVQGTFKGTSTGAVLEVPLSYSGNGYPIAVMIYPKNGFVSGQTIYDTIQLYAIVSYFAFKTEPSSTPTYPSSTAGAANSAANSIIYKSSTSSATTVSLSGAASNGIFTTVDPSATTSGRNSVRFKTNKAMRVFIASTSYGFMSGIDYNYCVVYSS